ncbi:acyl carrier protein [Nocardia aurantia]|uniref:Acyl carrier protein n=1 Tax=Nocardia aurantia TaxID=2585199 RepID=A0A7K0E0X4_9NOCA|nr:acyl carrier protein [Nocardia aurantia]MQY31740.1 Acyl carrier protein [Nocardia aurantia]
MTRNIAGQVDPDELKKLVARVLEVPAAEIADHADFADELGVDSLLQLELATRLETHYHVTIPATEVLSLTSLANVRQLIDRLLSVEPTGADPTLRSGGTT